MLGLVVTSVLIAETAIVNALISFQNSLERQVFGTCEKEITVMGEGPGLIFRGQVLPANFLKDTTDVELIHEGIKYSVQVGAYRTVMHRVLGL